MLEMSVPIALARGLGVQHASNTIYRLEAQFSPWFSFSSIPAKPAFMLARHQNAKQYVMADFVLFFSALKH